MEANNVVTKGKPLSKEVKAQLKKAAVLGTIQGPCADIIHPTRNGRKYDEELWDRTFSDPIVKEYFDNGGIPGELGHPSDREETDPTKIAIMMRKPPEKGKDGLLVGTWDILDTPNGRILKTLVDYGYKIGISSRGNGDTYDGPDGEETVQEDTYDFQAFDAVLLPAVKAARLTPIAEGLNSGKTLHQRLSEQLQSSSEGDKAVMEETLKELNIDCPPERADNIGGKAVSESERAVQAEGGATDGGPSAAVRSLQEALKAKSELEARVVSLQRQLAVGDAKVSELSEELTRFRGVSANLSAQTEKFRKRSDEADSLTRELAESRKTVQEQAKRISYLVEARKASEESGRKLNESVASKSREADSLREGFASERKSMQAEIAKLNESLAGAKADGELKGSESAKKLGRANALAESYRKLADSTMKRYIESKATALGVSPDEVRNRLGESFTADDVDDVCESLQSYSLNISKLPFSVSDGCRAKVKVTESKEPAMGPDDGGDDIDESLIRLAKSL